MKELWTNPDPSYHSSRWHFSDLKFSPKPLQKPHIPLWIGGSSPGAMRRAATMGDGWHPSGMSSEEFSAGREEVRMLASDAGRDPNALTMSYGLKWKRTAGRRASGRKIAPASPATTWSR